MSDESADAGETVDPDEDPANGDEEPSPSSESDAPETSEGADADADTDAETETGTDTNADSASASDSETDSGATADSDADSDADFGPDPDADSDSDSDSDSDADHPVETDGEGVVGGHEPGSESDDQSYPDPDEDVGGISTPPDDQEMPLADHIEEMILRVAVVLLFASAGTAIGLLGASQAIEHIWFNVFPYEIENVPPPHVYHPLELWLTRIKVSALLGIMVGLPVFVYQCYRFMKPGLYPHERKYYLAAVPTSVVLAGIGMLFSYVLVLPILFEYFTFYAEGSADIAYALGDTFDLIITLIGFLAIVFQIPLFIMLAIMMGVTTRRWLVDKRLYFWAAFFGLAFMFTFDPTAMAPILVGITMILLFEGTLLILKWVGVD
ncbi:Sec-independent protein translocase subunit TatC [Natrialba magadii ATCC 43099]|uniref:Sec-independent protein translocase protein TatC n=1 Tax=Natrialba magadii (strain ATCC 43099 / DSM 3394 / CCM 3739 / CIP 104546 / IAM 13178 / JCM 8861 / NBRC 102185 / NCIMB 2190 / MS3) TaxID=547559 RepID=D3SVL3_NATMM|nr:twin-arginine translocase subunit TatC [Natrialba magadii]ADD05621.1 Sec-independent protein translocase subunit TatC [Natrialba magadii ATCC 43099]ELY29966.1 Sec-independent periplasmic protein translocase [Natrialba magadii ATCC 43099]